MKILRKVPATLSVLAISGMVVPQLAQADILLSQRGCMTYATWSGNLVWARDLGADKEKARAELIVLDQKMPASIYSLMLRDLDSLWTADANWEQVTILVLQDCINRMGRYESAT
jgi:hypothetical protein